MKKIYWTISLLCICFVSQAQVDARLAAAMENFNRDEQCKFASVSLYVKEASGAVVFDQNSRMGLAPASTQKIITAATAFGSLGKDFTYTTRFGIVTTPTGKSLYIEASGDPTLGSWRWESTRDRILLDKLKTLLKDKGIRSLESVVIYEGNRGPETIPDGWIWQDIGNYYGASAMALNWRENQFDLLLKSGAVAGSAVSVVGTQPLLYDYRIQSLATAGPKGSGDRSYLYYPSAGSRSGVLTGTIPAGETQFRVSGSVYDPRNQFVKTLIQHLKGTVGFKKVAAQVVVKPYSNADWIFSHSSPELSKMVYWFLRKSINLYGEAFLKTIALKEAGIATTQDGIDALQKFWKSKGLDAESLHLYDGSGLSPQNRVTTASQVAVLSYAKEQPWFTDFYEALPLFNDMKMKSGTINRVKGFTGFHKSAAGKEYVFSFLVNNYNGSERSLVSKMFKVLDNLK